MDELIHADLKMVPRTCLLKLTNLFIPRNGGGFSTNPEGGLNWIESVGSKVVW